MTPQEIHSAFIKALVQTAPDLDAETIGDNDHLQDDLELDSIDIFNLVALIHEMLGVNIPEEDLGQIETPAKAAVYLAKALAAS